MKKFKFNLESVLKYRESIERYEKGVLSELNARLAELLGELEKLNNDYSLTAAEFEKMMIDGVSVNDIKSHHAIMENIAFYIQKKTEEIEAQRKLITKQTAVVVKAMRETKTINRLKEIKHEEYIKEENKDQEKFIEEFINHQTTVRKKIGIKKLKESKRY